MKNILITGALGQIGTELVLALRNLYGVNNIIASDLSRDGSEEIIGSGPFEIIDVTNVSK